MEYQVGSLADIISGTHDAASSNNTITYVPVRRNNVIPNNAVQKPPEISPGKNQIHRDSRTSQRRGKKGKETYFETNIDEVIEDEKGKPDLHSREHLVENEEEGTEDEQDSHPRRVRRKRNAIRNEEEESRTIFIKNIPYAIGEKQLKKTFREYGAIESIRLRCAPQADIRIPKKVSVITKKFHPDRTNISAFVRFKDKESVERALRANGSSIGGHHIFVDRVMKKEYDQKKAVFLGNVPYAAEENEIWKMFEKCGEIADIRVVRDSETGLGKGFAFVNFKDADAVELAVTLHGVKLRENELRVMRVTKKLKHASSQQNDRAFNSKRKWKKGGPESEGGSEKNNLRENKAPNKREKMRANKKHLNRNSENSFMSISQYDDTKTMKNKQSFTKYKKKVNLPDQQFQGQKITDKKKKKKKINKNELRKKVIAKKLTIGRKIAIK